VLDGADAVMLSGETSVGDHPALVVQYMAKIITETEKHYWPQIEPKRPRAVEQSTVFHSDVVCFNACRVAEEIHAKGIIGITTSGYSAFKISSFRPRTRIFIFSDNIAVLNSLNLLWGVQCFYYNLFTDTDGTIEDSTKILKETGFVEEGDYVINTGSMPMGQRYRTNMLKVTRVE
jgi:pyruvate kinase